MSECHAYNPLNDKWLTKKDAGSSPPSARPSTTAPFILGSRGTYVANSSWNPHDFQIGEKVRI